MQNLSKRSAFLHVAYLVRLLKNSLKVMGYVWVFLGFVHFPKRYALVQPT